VRTKQRRQSEAHQASKLIISASQTDIIFIAAKRRADLLATNVPAVLQ
jgi:hypothetical protein